MENTSHIDVKVSTFRNKIERLQIQLNTADEFVQIFPNPEHLKEIRSAKQFFSKNVQKVDFGSIDDFTTDCESMLKKTAASLKNIVVHCVGHAHIDMNWTWSYDETVAVIEDTFATMLKLMDRFPEFTFSQSQASVYEIIEKYNPNMLKQIQKRVKQGRWEVSSSTWVEADKNLSSGESQVRHILYTKRYFNKLFGLEYDQIALDFEPDTFGHPLTVPSILASGGVKYYYHCRGFYGPKLYRWQSPDGSTIIGYYEKDSWYIKTGAAITTENIGKFTINTIRETGLKDVLYVYGVGDHGGGPTVRDITNIYKTSSLPVFPTIKFSTYGEFFRNIEPYSKHFPVVKSEHNCTFTGCYTSQSEIKRAQRHGEKHLIEAETLQAIADKLSGEKNVRQKQITHAWKKHLFSQFHDILPGSGIKETREYTMGEFQKIIAITGSAKKSSLSTIGSLVNTADILKKARIAEKTICDRALGAGGGFGHDEKGISTSCCEDYDYRILIVYNPTPFPRSEIAEAILWDIEGKGEIAVRDCSGKDVESQVIQQTTSYWTHQYKKILFKASDIPPLGYKTFVAFQNPEKTPDTFEEWQTKKEYPAEFIFQNDILKIELDTISGAIKKINFKKNKKPFFSGCPGIGQFRIIDEASLSKGGMSAWLVGSYARIESLSGVEFKNILHIKGPLRNGFTWTAKIRNSQIRTIIYLDKGSSTIQMNIKCDWLETGSKETFVPQLNMLVPIPFKQLQRTFEIPFGSIARDTMNLDLPALRWVDVSGTDEGSKEKAGLTLTTDSKYGFRCGKDSVAISLLRSSHDPDPYPELGEHKFKIGLTPHEGSRNTSDCFRTANCFEHPLIVFQSSTHEGKMPLENSFAHLLDKNVVLSAFKQAEDGNSIIMRLLEVEGKDTQAKIQLGQSLFKEDIRVTPVDIMERKTGESKTYKNNSITCKIKAYGFVSLLIEPAKKQKE